MRCPICGDERTILKGTILKCSSCGAIEQVMDNHGRIISQEVWDILLDARAVAKYRKNPPQGVE